VARGARAAIDGTGRARHLPRRGRATFRERLIGGGVPARAAELLITREWAILPGETDYTTDTFQQITGRRPHPVAEFLHEYRAKFL
jgi:hypothetical protein